MWGGGALLVRDETVGGVEFPFGERVGDEASFQKCSGNLQRLSGVSNRLIDQLGNPHPLVVVAAYGSDIRTRR